MVPSRPVVLVTADLGPAALEVLGSDADVRHCDGTDRGALLAALPDAEALLVDAATGVDEEVLAAAGRLRIVACAGVGLDAVDVRAATRHGVMVVDAPTSAAVGTAELAVALMLAAARHVVPAHTALVRGRRQPEDLVGTELHGRTLGVVGLDPVGVLVAERLAAFGMTVVAHDPDVRAGRAAQMGVRMVSLGELMQLTDFLTVHLPCTTSTRGLVGAAELALARPGLVVVDVSPGGVLEEQALHDALVSGHVAAAGLDVHRSGADASSALLSLDAVVATPRLGAATTQAREKAGLAAAGSVRLALAGEPVPDAVNVEVGVVAAVVRPGLPLVEKLARILTALAGEVAGQVDLEMRGEISDHDVTAFGPAALTGVLHDVVAGPLTFVNAPLLAAERGVAVRLLTDPESPDHRNLITLRGALADGTQVSVSGTLVGLTQRERLVEVHGFVVDLEPTEHLAFLRYEDRPGVVGAVGRILGEAGINIAGMQVSRDSRGGQALVALSVDSAVPGEVLEHIRGAIDAVSAQAVDLS